jgi:hypothetical protein
MQDVFHICPQVRPARAAFDTTVHVGGFSEQTVNTRAVGYIFLDASGKRVRTLRHPAKPLSTLGELEVGALDVLAFHPDRPFDPDLGDIVRHRVQAFECGRFATAGRADEGQDFALAQVVADVCQGAGLISSDVQVVHLDDRSRDRSVQVRTFHGAGHVGRR